MNRITRISLLAIAGLVTLAALSILWAKSSDPNPGRAQATEQSTASEESILVRENSHKLTDVPGSKVTVVEFLDLECEACRAAYPGVEKLRSELGDRVTFVVRYFPIPSHQNAELAARAVEAASRQNKLEPMYQTMYDRQSEWGEQSTSMRALFVQFATELGLDVPQFERDLDDPAVMDRVRADRQDGLAAGVSGTPTFFINGTELIGRPTYEALKTVILDKLGK